MSCEALSVAFTFRTVSLRFLVAIGVLSLAVACSSEDPARQYSDEELGLDELVDDEVLSAIPFAQYRTLDGMDRDLVNPTAGSGHERERNYFEHLVALVMLAADDTLPPDVAIGSGVLHEAEQEAMDQCTADAGWPGVRVYDVSQELGEQYEREFGLTLEMFLDLRHECSKYAATYPTLDRAYRDELLAKRRAHYMAAVGDWMASNPELVVPVEYHEGANRPLGDYWISECQKTEDPQQCARDHLVTLP